MNGHSITHLLLLHGLIGLFKDEFIIDVVYIERAHRAIEVESQANSAW